MKTPRVRQENRISAKGFGRERLETAGAWLKPKEMAGRVAVEINPQPLIHPVSKRFPALEEQEIILTLLDPAARQVNLAGNFNGWNPEATPMKIHRLPNLGATGACLKQLKRIKGVQYAHSNQ